MKELDEKTALAILFSNTRRKKRTADLITIAEACEYLYTLYGSQKAVAKKIGLSPEMIREFRKILTLPAEVQDMLRARKIDRVDDAYRISMLGNREKQIAVARQVAGLQSDDVRDIKRLISRGRLSPQESKKKVLESRLKGLHVFMIDFDDDEYRTILEQSGIMKVDPAALVKQVVVRWLQARKRGTGKSK